MKKLLFIAFLFLSFVSYGQTEDTTKYFKYSGYPVQYDGVWTRNIFRLPDTANRRPQTNVPGAFGRNALGTKIFIWNGTAWVDITGGTAATGVTSVAKGWGILQDGTIIATGTITVDSVLLDARYIQSLPIDGTLYPVLDSTNTPPGSPVTDDAYMLGGAPTGAWAGHAADIATWNGSIWVFTDAVAGDYAYTTDDFISYIFRSGTWQRISGIPVLVNGNKLNSAFSIGTIDNRGIFLKTNNLNRLTITNNGTYTFNSLTGTGTRIAQFSSTGLVSALTNGSDGQVLKLVAGAPAWAAESGGLSATLTNAHLYVGNASNVATDVAASGDLTLANTGAFTFNTVNSNVGTFNNVTVNGKGLVTAASNVAYLTANEAITVTATGDATGVSTSSATAPSLPLVLATVNSNVGSFTNANITVDAKGRITAAANGSGGAAYTFSTGLTDAASTITANLSTGIAGGQSVIGGTAASEILTLRSTSHATKGKLLFETSGTTAYDGALGFFGVGITSPTELIHVKKDQNAGTIILVDNQTNGTAAGSQIKLLSASESTGFSISSLPSSNVTSGSPINLINSGTSTLEMRAQTAGRTVRLASTANTFSVGTSGVYTGISSTTPTFTINDGGTGAAASTLLRLQTTITNSGAAKRIAWFDGAGTIGSIDVRYNTNNVASFVISSLGNGVVYNSTDVLALWGTGNLILGSSVDAGHRLEVKGDGNFYGGLYVNNLGAVALPSLATVGTAGSTTITYKVVAKTSGGLTTAASSTASIATANATLSGSNYVVVTWTTVVGAVNYDVYRVSTNGTSPVTTGKIATVTNNHNTASNFYNDIGAAGDGNAAPTTSNIASTMGIGLSTTTAALHIRAGTADISGAPLKFTSGTLLATPEAGAVEFDGTHFYGTIGSTRHQLDKEGFAILGSTFAATNTVGAAGTQYVSIQSSAGNFNNTEAIRAFTCPVAGTLRNFYITTSGAQSGTGSFVLTVRKNGVDQTVVITIAAGAAEGNFSDVSNSFAVAAGDKISVKGLNNASVASTIVLSVGCIITNY